MWPESSLCTRSLLRAAVAANQLVMQLAFPSSFSVVTDTGLHVSPISIHTDQPSPVETTEELLSTAKLPANAQEMWIYFIRKSNSPFLWWISFLTHNERFWTGSKDHHLQFNGTISLCSDITGQKSHVFSENVVYALTKKSLYFKC